MFKKIMKEMLKGKSKHRHYSSSGYHKRGRHGHPSHYGHKHYKKKYGSSSSGFFHRSYSSS